MRSLLDKMRFINKSLQKTAGQPVDYNEMAKVLNDVIDCSVYIINREGKTLGCAYLKDLGCEIMRDIVENPAGFPEEYNDNLLKMTETQANFCQVGNACLFLDGKTCPFGNKVSTGIPLVGAGNRVGTLLLSSLDSNFNCEDLIVAEYGATIISMEILHSRTGKLEEEARKRRAVQVAVGTLSFSELDAVQHIFRQLDGDEGLLVASKIADQVGITRSVIVNALRKFESAGVIESKSLGMKGTYIRVLNDHLINELDRLRRR